MPTTRCEKAGAVYQLVYTKMSSKRGSYYFGKIDSNPVTGFAFTALNTGGHEFDDSREPIYRQEAIVSAIKAHESQ